MVSIGAAMKSSESSATAATTQPTPVRTRDGACLVAGLTWHAAKGMEFPVFKENAPLVLRLPEFRAEIDKSIIDARSGSLLIAMAAGLLRDHPDCSGTWVFIAGIRDADDNSVYLLAITDLSSVNAEHADIRIIDRIVPRAGSEGIFRNADDILTVFQSHLVTMEIAGIATCRPVDHDADYEHIIQELALAVPDMPSHEIDLHPENLPVFTAPTYISTKWIGFITVTFMFFLVLFLVIIPTIRSWYDSLQPPPPAPIVIDAVIEKTAFAENCMVAMNKWWPRYTGWNIDNQGCAIGVHVPDTLVSLDSVQSDHLSDPMTVWTHYTLDGKRNAVVAYAYAERFIKEWPNESIFDTNSLTLWYTVPLPIIKLVQSSDTVDQSSVTPKQIRNQLVNAWAESPNTVSTSGDGFTVSPPVGISVKDIFERSAGISGFEPVRFIQRASTKRILDLVPVNVRQVPLSFFSSLSTETSK